MLLEAVPAAEIAGDWYSKFESTRVSSYKLLARVSTKQRQELVVLVVLALAAAVAMKMIGRANAAW